MTLSDVPITSHANAVIRLTRSLQRRRGRTLERAFLLEGYRALADAVTVGATPKVVLLREGTSLDPLPRLKESVPVRWVAAALFDEVAATLHPQGVLAVLPIPDLLPAVLETPLTLVVDGVRDPGNLGTLLRSAAAAEVDQVLITPTTVDPFNPKAVRAGMGAQLRLALASVGIGALSPILGARPLVALADADGDRTYDDVDWTGAAAIIVGGEAFGPTPELAAMATVRVRIPLARGVESLNAGVAGSILLFEAVRQRRRADGSAARTVV